MEIREALEAAVVEHEAPAQAQAQAQAPEQSVPEQSAPAPEQSAPAPEQSAPAPAPEQPAPAPAPAPAPTTDDKANPAPAADDKTKPAPAADDKAKPAVTTPETSEQRLQHRLDRPPVSWRKEAKGDWATMPLQVRQEVHKREMEIDRVLKETAPIRQEMETIKNTISPYMARIQSLNTTPVQAIDSLLKADHFLATAPRQQRAEFLAKMIADYDVDVQDLDQAIAKMMQGNQSQQSNQSSQSSNGFDPAVINRIVQEQLNQALAPFQQELQQREQSEQQKIANTIESMSLDPKYPYFDVVREDMADLMEMYGRRGVALSFEDAYDRAVRVNPETYGQVTQQSTLSQANQQHLQAQKAKVAGSSVTGALAGGGQSVFVGDDSLRSQIEAAFNNSRI